MRKTARYEMLELSLARTSQRPADGNPTAVFTQGEARQTIRGFAENADLGTVRFMPLQEGEWHYTLTWGEVEEKGSFLCTPAEGQGPVRAVGQHFCYDAGGRYVPLGTTCYAWVHQAPAVIAQTLKTLQTAPFNKIRMCLFPKSMPYNQNDPANYPFEKGEDGAWDVSRPDLRYWAHLDECLRALADRGVQADLILFHPYDRWGFATMPQADNLAYLDYAVRRLAAYHHVWWSLSNEYEFSFQKTIADWDAFGELVHREDPYGHLLSAHNWITPYPKRDWLTHVSYQGGSPREAFNIRMAYELPVIVDEIGYEGDIEPGWGNLSGFEFINRVWTATAFGCYVSHGETFHREDEVLWWAKGGLLYGEAPQRLHFLKGLLDSLPGPMEPACLEAIRDPNGSATSEGHRRLIQRIWEMNSEKARQQIILEQTRPIGVHPDYKLVYLERSAQSLLTLRLPEDGLYRVELIDVWAMRRTLAASRVRGDFVLGLPGREGTAVLITRLEGQALS